MTPSPSLSAAAAAGTAQQWRDETRATLKLAWPMVLTNLAQSAPTTIDVVMLGWLGPTALAAGALGTNLYFAFLIFGIGLITAVSPMVAKEIGARRSSVRDVRRTVRQGLWTAVAITLPSWALLWHSEPILLALGQEPALAERAGLYLRALQWALLPFLGYIVLRSFIAALERPMWGLWAGLAGTLVNTLLAWCLIFGKLGFPRLELVGAGIATTIACAVMFGFLAIVVSVDRKFRRYHLFGRFWRADWPRFAGLWRLGLPIAATLVFEVSIFNAAVFLMGLIGANSVAAHSIAIQIASITFMVPLGFGQAATVRVGLAYGAGDRHAISRAGWTAFAMGVGFMALAASLILLAPGVLIGAFLDRGDPANAEVVRLATLFLVFAAIFQLADGAQVTGAGMLRGLHDTRVPMLIAALGYWGVGLPLGIVLAFPLGYQGAGIWVGLAVGLGVVAVLMTARWLMRERLGLTGEAAGAPPATAPAVVASPV
jgi:multidrug resistance protein, MATE family